MPNYNILLHVNKPPIGEECFFMLHKKYLKTGAVYLE
jgi:hypothetical protein